ncbi:peptidyl-prolyl cis-trans isomerase Fpr2p [Monosporozyma unispora]|nr:Peptidyl-prolyl cis-trans isomerase fpr2 [Kazachstania unispora]
MKFSSICFMTLLGSAMAGTLKELEIDITKRIPADKCTNKALVGDNVRVHYTGKLLENGKKFDSSYDRNQPIAFKLGTGRVIEGWDQGLVGMCVGEERTLRIPSKLAYGANGIPGVIPKDADLVFDVKLVSALH